MRVDALSGYTLRAYAGASDHAAMAAALTATHLANSDGELVTTEQIATTYTNLPADELARSVVIIEHELDGVVGYGRAGVDDTPEGRTQFWVTAFQTPHLRRPLFMTIVERLEQIGRERSAGDPPMPQMHRCWVGHPGPDQPLGDTPVGWLTEEGYRAVRFGANMVRPHLDEVPQLALPASLEIRPVTPDHLRTIWEAEVAAFAGSFGTQEATEWAWLTFRDDPIADPSLWKVAWHGGQLVGQVRSYINDEENTSLGRRRGYTENISTHREWRGRGLASALLAASLVELRERGMREAALGVDTENPADAFSIYERLGFRLTSYEAVLDKPVR